MKKTLLENFFQTQKLIVNNIDNRLNIGELLQNSQGNVGYVASVYQNEILIHKSKEQAVSGDVLTSVDSLITIDITSSKAVYEYYPQLYNEFDIKDEYIMNAAFKEAPCFGKDRGLTNAMGIPHASYISPIEKVISQIEQEKRDKNREKAYKKTRITTIRNDSLTGRVVINTLQQDVFFEILGFDISINDGIEASIGNAQIPVNKHKMYISDIKAPKIKFHFEFAKDFNEFASSARFSNNAFNFICKLGNYEYVMPHARFKALPSYSYTTEDNKKIYEVEIIGSQKYKSGLPFAIIFAC